MEITKDLIKALAINDSALKNGSSLVKSGKYLNLSIDKDNTVIFGACSGSGSKNYECSFDFINEANPIARCNCPSRQIPCKHAMGLLVAFEENKESFKVAEVPEDILRKREKIEKSATKKEEDKVPKVLTEKEIKAKSRAEVKKINNQLTGVSNGKEIIKTIVSNGLASIDKAKIKDLESEVKNLGNFHISGIEFSFKELLDILQKDDENFTKSIIQINYIKALLTKAEKYLTEKLENPLNRDIETKIEEQIGHIWNYKELLEVGLSQEKGQLVQLYFEEITDEIKKQFEETAVWFDVSTKKLCKSVNYRPFKAKKHVKETDSTKSCVLIDELYFYPSENTPRVTIKEFTLRDVNKDDLQTINECVCEDYSLVIKDIKNIFKGPLSDKELYYLVKVDSIKVVGDCVAIVNKKGENIVVNGESKTPVKFIYNKDFKDKTTLIKISKDTNEKGEFVVDILSVVREEDIFVI